MVDEEEPISAGVPIIASPSFHALASRSRSLLYSRATRGGKSDLERRNIRWTFHGTVYDSSGSKGYACLLYRHDCSTDVW